MVGEAAARPQKLQKLGQMLHSLDRTHDDGKVAITRTNGPFVRASDDLERTQGRIPKPRVAGSNPAGGADAFGLRECNGALSGHAVVRAGCR